MAAANLLCHSSGDASLIARLVLHTVAAIFVVPRPALFTPVLSVSPLPSPGRRDVPLRGDAAQAGEPALRGGPHPPRGGGVHRGPRHRDQGGDGRHARTHKHAHTSTHTQARTHKHALTSTHTQARTRKHAHTSTHTQARTNKHAHTSTYQQARTHKHGHTNSNYSIKIKKYLYILK